MRRMGWSAKGRLYANVCVMTRSRQYPDSKPHFPPSGALGAWAASGRETRRQGQRTFRAIHDVEVVPGSIMGQEIANLRDGPVIAHAFDNLGRFARGFQ